jgi:hypothetical protein
MMGLATFPFSRLLKQLASETRLLFSLFGLSGLSGSSGLFSLSCLFA